MNDAKKLDFVDTKSVNSINAEQQRRSTSKAPGGRRLLAFIGCGFYVAISLAIIIILAQALRGSLGTADQCLTLPDQGGQQPATTVTTPRIREAKKDPLVDLSSSTSTLPRTGTFLISSFIPAPPAAMNSTSTVTPNSTTATTAQRFERTTAGDVGSKRERDADSNLNNNKRRFPSLKTKRRLVKRMTIPVWAVVLVCTIAGMAMIGLLVCLWNLGNLD